MKHIYNLLTPLLFLFALIANTGCNDDKNDLIPDTFEISSSDLTRELDSRSATINVSVKTNLRVSQWSVNSDAKWVTAFQQEDKIILSILDNADLVKRFAKVTIQSDLGNYTISLTQYGVNDIPERKDTQIRVTSGLANQAQPGNDSRIENSFDGDYTTGYHSPWGDGTKFPVELEYYFKDNDQIIDRVVYTSNSNGNGYWGKVDIYAKESGDAEYKFIEQHDFKRSEGTFPFDLVKGIKATAIKFSVLDGTGNFATCKEVEFFQKANYRDLNAQLLSIFTDYTCTALNEGVTNEMIDALTSESFRRVAYALKNNTYDPWEKEFRVREYEAYSNIAYWKEQLQTKHYSDLDNPTGIYVAKDEEVVVLVGDMHGQKITLQCIWENDQKVPGSTTDTYKQTQAQGISYILTEGVNLLKMKGPGQLFVMYNTDLTTNPQPIKIHIPLGHGVVNGFFDLKEHKTDAKYSELIHKATHKYFCVRGDKMMFYFHRLKMMDAAPDNILSAINLWDDIVGWEQSLMGISAKRESGEVNNHMMAISPEGSYMWASDYYMGFVYTYLRNILLRENVMAVEDNAWGPAHEMGHVHQYAINWPMSTESSNNLFSNYVIRRLGKYKSRGKGLIQLANSVYKDKKAWYNMGTSTHQNEDTEIHMRMNWQLWIYYELCKGNGESPKFWPIVFDIMRSTYRDVPENDPGARQLAFAKAVCVAAEEDLTEFFETWGFFKTVDNEKVNQYGDFIYNVTDQMIADTKAFIKAKNYPKAAPIQYIEDRLKSDFPSGDYRYKEVGDLGYYTQFTNNVKITKQPTYTISTSVTGSTIVVKDGEQAVAFEVRKTSDTTGELGPVRYFANFLKFDVPRQVILAGTTMYAVQADGVRVEMQKAQ